MKRVLITGAGSGIGKAAAELFAQSGYDVILHYHTSKTGAEETVTALRARHFSASCVQADLTKADEAARMFQEIGTIDVLVNNAGVAQQKLFTDTTEEDWDCLFHTNVKSMFFCAKLALRGMLQRHSGAIINVSSMWGQVGASCEVAYSASKAAVLGLTKALAKEVGPSGIRVNCIAPGVIDTPMNQTLTREDIAALKEETPLGTIGTPMDVAKTMLFLAGDDSAFLTGQVLGVNGGMIL